MITFFLVLVITYCAAASAWTIREITRLARKSARRRRLARMRITTAPNGQVIASDGKRVWDVSYCPRTRTTVYSNCRASH